MLIIAVTIGFIAIDDKRRCLGLYSRSQKRSSRELLIKLLSLSPLARTSPVSLIFQHTLNVEREKKTKFQNLTVSHVTKDAIAFEIGLIAIAACCVLSVRL